MDNSYGEKYMKMDGEQRNRQLHAFLTSALDGGEWSASYHTTLLPVKEPLVPI
jgi:hypothetical protein